MLTHICRFPTEEKPKLTVAITGHINYSTFNLVGSNTIHRTLRKEWSVYHLFIYSLWIYGM